MDFIKVILTSLLSIVTLFILTKLMGNRQMSQLSMFDYINGITIGSIAAELATDLEGDFWQPVVAMAVYAVVTVCITFITTKSIGARRLLTGRWVILFENGKFADERYAPRAGRHERVHDAVQDKRLFFAVRA